LLALVLFLSACVLNRPPLYEKEVSERLQVEASEQGQKDRLVEHEPCDLAFLEKYAASDIVAVRVLITGNPGANDALIDTLSTDDNSFVRAAVASSQRTPRRVLERLLGERNIFVRSGLASNGNLTADEIRSLYASFEDPPLVRFAMNPNLPPEIREEIVKSDDGLAKEWLKITESRWK
jgi:hypothetical protein